MTFESSFLYQNQCCLLDTWSFPDIFPCKEHLTISCPYTLKCNLVLHPEISLPSTICKKKKNYLSPQAQPLGALYIDTSTPEAHISKISLVGMTDFNSFNICSEVLTELLTIYTIMNNFSPSLVQLKGHSHI